MKRPRLLPAFAALFFFVATPGLRAALEQDLGQSLTYLRVNDAAADTPATVASIARHPALVLDLRCVISDAGQAEALQAALAKPPPTHAARIILINATTAPALIAVLTDDLPHVVTIGPRTPALTPDIAIATTEEKDRAAYDALTTGTPLEKLINSSLDKRRYDEAKLVQDHSNGITPDTTALPADAEDDSVTPSPAKDEKKSVAPEKKNELSPLVDLVLERAVQLHRSLLAIKKL